jgi:hypothetical protein
MRDRLSWIFIGSLAAACGGGEGTKPDAPPVDNGFNKPTASLKANTEVSDNMWMELGPADLSCLNTPSADAATTVVVKASTTVKDFQSGSLVPNTVVTAYPNQTVGSPFDTQTADGNAALTITIPVGTKRFGYKMTNPEALDTLLLNQTVKPDMATQTVSAIQSVSKTTAATLPALIGVSRTPGTGVLAGAMRDCQDREVSNFVATVSTTQGSATIASGADSYYFSSSVGLPVRHSQQAASSNDGLFMVIELAPQAEAFVQVWGYPTDADLAADKLTLIAELQTAVVADTVITGSYEPLRQ